MACKLRVGNASDSAIQRALRWKSPEMVRVYGRADAESFAGLIESCLRHDATGIRVADLPELDPVAAAEEMAHIIDHIGPEAVHAAAAGAAKAATELRTAATGTAAKRKRTRAPALNHGPAASSSAPEPAAAFDLGDRGLVRVEATDTSGLCGATVCVPDSVWPGHDEARSASACVIVGRLPAIRSGTSNADISEGFVVRDPAGFHYGLSLSLVRSLLKPRARAALKSAGVSEATLRARRR